jgi:hypothetical protein
VWDSSSPLRLVHDLSARIAAEGEKPNQKSPESDECVRRLRQVEFVSAKPYPAPWSGPSNLTLPAISVAKFSYSNGMPVFGCRYMCRFLFPSGPPSQPRNTGSEHLVVCSPWGKKAPFPRTLPIDRNAILNACLQTISSPQVRLFSTAQFVLRPGLFSTSKTYARIGWGFAPQDDGSHPSIAWP